MRKDKALLTPRQVHFKNQSGGYPKISVGGFYPFFSEVQEEYVVDPSKRLRNYTWQVVEVVEANDLDDPEFSPSYKVCAANGYEFTAWEEELNGWDFDLGQYFEPETS